MRYPEKIQFLNPHGVNINTTAPLKHPKSTPPYPQRQDFNPRKRPFPPHRYPRIPILKPVTIISVVFTPPLPSRLILLDIPGLAGVKAEFQVLNCSTWHL
ncbi:hypothetical protein TWF730_006629 [Orbilia blumenaviensis]|uniref:Uncharacterized protein n=1 Tax=Orbilia blumenaviensis TaxID=1796055 RepID=A0AAV9VFC3_9PEZI